MGCTETSRARSGGQALLIGGREALPEGVTGRRAGVTLINVEALDSHGHRCLGGQRGAFSGLDASLLETACVMGTFSPSLPLVP